MAEEEFVGCISCLGINNLCDLFAPLGENLESYAKIFNSCFNIKAPNDFKFICSACGQKLLEAASFKDQTARNISVLLANKDEEYLDESILAEADVTAGAEPAFNGRHVESHDFEDDVKPFCGVCNEDLQSRGEPREHMRCPHGVVGENEDQKEFSCHFCNNTYPSRKACYTHLRMKHGLKLTNEQTPKHAKRERKKCHICGRDFSQKQILNKHLMKEHGVEVEKRKALDCPLCDERVSYGVYFSDHLLAEHDIDEEVEELQFQTMDDFIMYKSSIQEETKYRFRKTTATKQTIEGLRSHYMCSQSGVYVYQGKGIRPAPERQIYKTGKACPAHMVVTEAIDCVKVVFHKTHVGHGACPYYEPRDSKRQRLDKDVDLQPLLAETGVPIKQELEDPSSESRLAWICDACGMVFFALNKFKHHAKTHDVFGELDD